MSNFQITGGISLRGEVACGGSKNAALPIMAATILAHEPVRLLGVPRLADVRTQSRILRRLGVGATADGGGVIFETFDHRPVRAPQRLVRRMRAGFCVLGPLLARRGKAVVPLPGGCNLGHRPVDLHLKGLAALGADIRLQHGYVVATAQRLAGAEIDLLGPCGSTVTGTANVLCAAVTARGVTIIRNAAVEPEIVDLGRFLTSLGAKIEGVGSPTLRIDGVERLGGATHRLIPDRIEAATLLLAAAITGGSVTVTNAAPEHLDAVVEKLRETGAVIESGGDWVSIDATNSPLKKSVMGKLGATAGLSSSESDISRKSTAGQASSGTLFQQATKRLRSVDVVARPYPGFPTDLQPQWTALASVGAGTCQVEDRVFPGRFMHVAELNRMGADVAPDEGTVRVTGLQRLDGAEVSAPDLRAGAALLLAGLAAEGKTVIEHVRHIDRGHERIDAKLRRLGARIERSKNHPLNSAIPNSPAMSFSLLSKLASGAARRRANSK